MINNGPPLRTIQDTVTHTLETSRRYICKIIYFSKKKQETNKNAKTIHMVSKKLYTFQLYG